MILRFRPRTLASISRSLHTCGPSDFLNPAFLKRFANLSSDRDDSCVDYSIFRPFAAKSLSLRSVVMDFQRSPYATNQLVSRSLGCLLSHVMGDSIGATLEFSPVDYQLEKISSRLECFSVSPSAEFPNVDAIKAGQFTDDSAMALCLADSLILCGGLNNVDLRTRFLRWWLCGYNNGFRFDQTRADKRSIGLGLTIANSFAECINKGEITDETKVGDSRTTNGNGSIMRLSPLPIFYHDDWRRAAELSARQSLTTHRGEEAADCCRLLAFLIAKAMRCPRTRGKFAHDFLETIDVSEIVPCLKTPGARALIRSQREEDCSPYLGRYCHGPDDRDWDWKKPDYRYSPTRAAAGPGFAGGYAMDAMAMALHCVYKTNTLEESILKAANLGGDSDSVAAVTGQIAGALYGIEELPMDWREHLLRWDNGGEIALRVLCMLDQKIRQEAVAA